MSSFLLFIASDGALGFSPWDNFSFLDCLMKCKGHVASIAGLFTGIELSSYKF